MQETLVPWFVIGLDLIAITFTLWVFSLARPSPSRLLGAGFAMLAWVALLHVGLSTKRLFPADTSGPAFLSIILLFVGIAGAVLLVPRATRRFLFGLEQEHLMLLQGIRVFFGANFLMQASLGLMPRAFGIVDGWTHIAAGFFGLVASYSLAAGVDGERRAWFANLFGLADILVVASSIAFILLPDITPYHSVMYIVFFPAPLWLWFHVISLWKLARRRVPVREAART